MKRLTAALTALMLLAAVVSAQEKDHSVLDRFADEWLVLVRNGVEVHQYNPSRLSREGDLAKGWFRVVDEGDGEILRTIMYEFRCGKAELRGVTGAVYFDYRERIGQDLKPAGRERYKLDPPDAFNRPKVEFRAIVPDSIGEMMNAVACRKDP